MVDTYYYVYKITNNVSKTVYIGITKDINTRFREHKNNSHNKYLRNSILVYGIDNFLFEVLETVESPENASNREIFYINEYKKLGNVYNISKGGLIGNGMPGINHWNAKFTEDDILNIRELYASTKITQKKLGELFNTTNKHISKIVRGDRWKELKGPLSKNLTKNKVANRRKLTDDQIIQVRKEALEEFELTGKLNIPEIADMYNISRQSMRLILTGKVYKNLPGPLLKKDYYSEFGRNEY